MNKLLLISRELRFTIKTKRMTTSELISYSIFISLLTMALYFVMQAFKDSFLFDSIPALLSEDYFGVLLCFLLIEQCFFIMYFSVNYNEITFKDFYENKWYLLIQLKFNPTWLIIYRLIIRCLRVFFIYTLSYGFTFLFLSFWPYTILTNHIISIYFVGLLNLYLTIIPLYVYSIYIKTNKYSKIIPCIIVAIIWILTYVTNFHFAVTNYALMALPFSTFIKYYNTFPLITLFTLVISFILILIKGRKLSRTTNFKMYAKDYDLNLEDELVLNDKYENFIKAEIKPYHKKNSSNQYIFLDFLFFVVISLCIGFMAFSSVIHTSDTQSHNNYSLVFKNDHLLPTRINIDDLVFMKNINDSYTPAINDIILYEDETKNFLISHITDIDEKTHTVGVDNYAEMNVAMKTSFSDTHDLSLYLNENRMYGLFIQFFKSTPGKLTVLLPLLFLVFRHIYIRRKSNKKNSAFKRNSK